MDTTLIIHEENALTSAVCALMGRVLGPSVCMQPQEFDGDFSGHSRVAVAFAPEEGKIPLSVKRFLKSFSPALAEKRVALVCFSSNRAAAARALKSAARRLPKPAVITLRVPLPARVKAEMSAAGRVAANETANKIITLRRVLLDGTELPPKQLTEHIDTILQAHNTCALCTAHGGAVRATPIEYIYRGGAFYFLSEGGEKFAHLYAAPRVSIAVFEPYSGFDKLLGVQAEGTAEPIAPFSGEYIDFIESKGLSAENLKKLPVTLNLFKVVPERIEILDSSLAKEGFGAKQVWKRTD